MGYNIIVDTRENYVLDIKEHTQHASSVILKKLDTGDYSIEGFEHLLCIERKRGTAEYAMNSTEKRFKAELVRMQSFKYKYVIFECDYHDFEIYPENSTVPRYMWKKLRVKGPYLLKSLELLRTKYGIATIFAGDALGAAKEVGRIMDEVYLAEFMNLDDGRLHPY